MMDTIIQKIKEKGGRMTIQRLAILELLSKLGHPTAEEIFQFTQNQFPSVSFTTVYNTLKSFKELGVVREYYMEERSRFELTEHLHPHFHCFTCEGLTDLDPAKITVEMNPSLDEEWSPLEKEVIFHGICPSCRRNRDKS